jgi:outer membrane protein
MLNKLVSTAVVAILFTAPVVSAEMNIVVLDPVRAILESEEAKVLAEAANKEMQPEQEELRAAAEEMQALQAKLQKDGEVMSDSERRKAIKDLESMQADIQFGSQKLQKEAQDRRQEILQALAPKYEKVLSDLIQIDQIDLILSPNQLQYANAKHDISRRVTEKAQRTSRVISAGLTNVDRWQQVDHVSADSTAYWGRHCRPFCWCYEKRWRRSQSVGWVVLGPLGPGELTHLSGASYRPLLPSTQACCGDLECRRCGPQSVALLDRCSTLLGLRASFAAF